jgi:hypothetical protein
MLKEKLTTTLALMLLDYTKRVGEIMYVLNANKDA